jgi:hypothetical protein
MHRFIVQLITEPKVKDTCVLTELEEENIVALTYINSTVLEMTDDEVVEVA